MSTRQREAAAGPGGLCTKEIRKIPAEAYRDSNGAPACYLDWNTARCRFVSIRRSDPAALCAVTGLVLSYMPADSPPNKRREKYSLLRPVEGCPVWVK